MERQFFDTARHRVSSYRRVERLKYQAQLCALKWILMSKLINKTYAVHARGRRKYLASGFTSCHQRSHTQRKNVRRS